MTILLVQTFLLLLGAFLLGASLACFFRRAFSGRAVEAGAPAIVVPAAAAEAPAPTPALTSTVDTDRFGRALSGGAGPAVPPVFHGAPVVEVQPAPAPVSPREQVSTFVPPPSSSTSFAPPPSAPPPPVRVEVVEAPARAPEPQPVAPEPPPEVAPTVAEVPSGPSYAEVAVAAAAAAAAAAKVAAEAAAAEEAVAAEEAAAAEKAAAEEAAVADVTFDAGDAGEQDAGGIETTQLVSPVDVAIGGAADDLSRIRAIDVGMRDRLHRLGVLRFADIAAWSPSDVSRFSQSLGIQGRIESENWIEQAEILAAGGEPDVGRSRGGADQSPEAADRAAPLADGDRLHRIIGIDPDSEAKLYSVGVTRLADIAAWSNEDVDAFEELLGTPGRVRRENWVEQARFLTRGSGGSATAAAVAAVAVPAAAAAAIAARIAEAVPAQVDEPAVQPEPSEPAPSSFDAPADSEPDDVATSPLRTEGYSGLRSVRSEALRGDGTGAYVSRAGEVDDLKRIRGIGVLIEKKLHSLGIVSYEQVANWTNADIDRVSQILDFKGRIERENWIEQARILASGGQTEFSTRIDRGDI